MEKSDIKDYILKYKDSYSKEIIREQLVKAGASEEDIDSIYNSIESKSTSSNAKSIIGLILILTGVIIPILGIIMIIVGIILGFSNRKNTSSKLPLVVIILGFVCILPAVLFQGALITIFSLLNFGELLPNTVDLNNNFRGDPTQSLANAPSNTILIAFSYIGNSEIHINGSDYNQNYISDVFGGSCGMNWVKNIDTDTATSKTSPDMNIESDNVKNSIIKFSRGDMGMAEFDCSSDAPTPANKESHFGLIKNSIFEGDIKITAMNLQTSLPIISEGRVRLTVQD